MEHYEVTISFPATDPLTGNRLAAELAAQLSGIADGVAAKTRRDTSDSQDFGSLVAVVLGAPAVIAVAQGLADWIRKQGRVDIEISREVVRLENVADKDLEKILELMLSKAIEK